MRAWLAVPALGAVGCAAAVALGRGPWQIAAAGGVAAAVTAALRVLAPVGRRKDDDPDATAATLVGAITGALVALAFALDASRPLGWVAVAAAAWAIAELARPHAPGSSPAVALAPALLAAALDPAYVALVLVAGLRVWRAPTARPRWVVAVPIAGALAIGAALLAWRSGGALWQAWSPHRAGDTAQLAQLLGPLGAVAALAGLTIALRACIAWPAWRPIAYVALGAAIAADRAVSPALLLVAALAIGVAVGRLAAIVRHPAGQACIGAACGFLLVVEPLLNDLGLG